MKHLKKIFESKSFEEEVEDLEDCFMELIDEGACFCYQEKPFTKGHPINIGSYNPWFLRRWQPDGKPAGDYGKDIILFRVYPHLGQEVGELPPVEIEDQINRLKFNAKILSILESTLIKLNKKGYNILMHNNHTSYDIFIKLKDNQ